MSEEQLIAEGEFGDKVKAFVESDIGRYLISAKEVDEREAFQKLLALDPYEFTDLPKLQNAIATIQENVILARKVHGYLADAIIRGQQADELLLNTEET